MPGGLTFACQAADCGFNKIFKNLCQTLKYKIRRKGGNLTQWRMPAIIGQATQNLNKNYGETIKKIFISTESFLSKQRKRHKIYFEFTRCKLKV